MSTILYFGASWCGPCKAVKASLEELKEADNLGVTFYDVEEYTALSQSYNVRGVPTLIKLDKDGKQVSMKVGMQSHKQLKDWMEE